ncbi:MAG: DNA cytosine methyltransferase [Acidobacteriota bacterium]
MIFGEDVRDERYPFGRFDGVIGGPPCQAFSVLKRVHSFLGVQEKFGNLIPEFERVVGEVSPTWFLMENVRHAPIPQVTGYIVTSTLVRDVWVGGETLRLRRFSFGSLTRRRFEVEWVALHRPDPEVSVLAGGGSRSMSIKIGGSGKPKRYGNSGRRTAIGRGGDSKQKFLEGLIQQGLPAHFLERAPFTLRGKCEAIGNGVPRAMGLAIAKAVKRAMYVDPA